MTGFFDRMLGRGSKEGSGAIAKSRLEVVLVHDRINLSPVRLRELKEELLAVIAKYIPIDPDSVDIAVEQPDRHSSKLVAHIPIGKGKILDLASMDEYTEDDDLDDVMKKLSDDSEELLDARPPAEPEAAASEAATSTASMPDSEPDKAVDTPPENDSSDKKENNN